jgi:hypothetical protein
MQNELRRWIQLIEMTGQSTVVRVFHGSREPKLNLRSGLFYGVRDFGFAASYAVAKGANKHGFVHTLDFRFNKLAHEKVVYDIANELNVDLGVSHAVTVPEQHHGYYRQEFDVVVKRIKQLGYDGITGYDFGFRDDFEELVVWLVFDAVKQITPIAVTPVTRADMKRLDAPT